VLRPRRLLGLQGSATWATVLITLGASVIAVVGTLAAARMQLRNSSREREIAERDRWREKGAEVVGPLNSLLEEAEPLRLGLTLETWRARLDGLWERWVPLREQLTGRRPWAQTPR
jgi:hypothetical protein